jgi:predicted DNA-binding protein
MKKKGRSEKTAHMFICPDLHARLKEQAKSEGKKLRYFTNELIEWAIDYKNFLSKK